MINRLIKTEKDYNQAIKRIEALMHAEADSPEADETASEALIPKHYWPELDNGVSKKAR